MRRVLVKLIHVSFHPTDPRPWGICYWRLLPNGKREYRYRQHYWDGRPTIDRKDNV